MNRVQLGVWGQPIYLIKSITLTTCEGLNNTWPELSHHFNVLIHRLRDKGLKVEYVMSPELSPASSLLHLHGLLRIEDGELSELELQIYWSEIHGASQVRLEEVKNVEALERYIVKHMLKQYPEAMSFKGRLLMSRGWCPEGWKKVRKILTKWALEREYLFGVAVWKMLGQFMMRWCAGQTIAVHWQGAWLYINGQNFTYREDKKDGTGSKAGWEAVLYGSGTKLSAGTERGSGEEVGKGWENTLPEAWEIYDTLLEEGDRENDGGEIIEGS